MFVPKIFAARQLWFALVLCIVAGTSTARGADLTILIEHLPTNASMVLATRNVGATCAAFQRTELGAEVCGPNFEPLVAELRKRDRGGPLHLRPWSGFDWTELAMCQSPAALAAFPLKGGNAGVVWLFADSADRQALFTSTNGYFAKKKWLARKGAVGDASTTTYSPPAKAPGRPLIWFETKSYYGIADSAAAVDVVVTMSAKMSLATTPTGEHLAAKGEEQDGGRFFVQPLALWQSLTLPPPGKKLPLRDPVRVADRLGFGGIQSISGTLLLDPEDGGAWELEGELVVPKPYKRVLKALELIPGPPVPLPNWVDGSAKSVIKWRWDFRLGMEAMGHFFDESVEPGPDGEGLFNQILDGLRDDPEGPMVDLRKSLFNRLGPEVIAIKQDVDDAGKPIEQQLFVATCREQDKVVKLLTDFYKGDKLVTASKVGDFHLWTVEPGGNLFVAGEGKSSLSLRAVAVGAGYIWMATEPTLLLDAIKAHAAGEAGKPLVKTKLWEEYEEWLAKRAIKGTALDSWEKPLAWANAYEAARAPAKPKMRDTLSTQVWMFLLFGSADRAIDHPYKAAPAFAKWGDHLPPVARLMSESKGGWSVVVGAPPPAAPPP
jgi:hypothetical protein